MSWDDVTFETYLWTRHGAAPIAEVTNENLLLVEKDPVYVNGAMVLTIHGVQLVGTDDADNIVWMVGPFLDTLSSLAEGQSESVCLMPPTELTITRLSAGRVQLERAISKSKRKKAVTDYERLVKLVKQETKRFYLKMDELFPNDSWLTSIPRDELVE